VSTRKIPFDILPATWRDLGALRHLERECFPRDGWPLLDLIGVLSFPNFVRLKAVIQDKMVGFVAGDLRPSKDLAWIATIGVLPAYQRQGIASALLSTCEDRLTVSRIRLSVRVGNLPAINLYKGFGYQRLGKWASYYQDGSDALVFEKSKLSAL
jgi:ribosomal protein S18 acetylase RimI-like enzyme